MTPLIYVDTSEVREGSLEELKNAIAELADFVEANEPRLISYSVYFSDDGSRMTVTHVHSDPASLDFHMDVAGPRFERFADLVTLSSIHIYGEPSPKAVEQLRQKLELLGSGSLAVHRPHVLDAGDVQEVVLVKVRQVPFHLCRVHSAVGLGDVDRRHIQRRKDVAAHAIEREECAEHDGHDNGHDRKRPA